MTAADFTSDTVTTFDCTVADAVLFADVGIALVRGDRRRVRDRRRERVRSVDRDVTIADDPTASARRCITASAA